MKSRASQNLLLLPRLLIVPAAAIMVSATILVGLASSRHPYTRAGKPGKVSLVRRDSPALPGQPLLHDIAKEGAEQSVDPVEDYKATLELLKRNYYGEPIDKRKTQALTTEAIRGMVGSLKDQFSSFLDPDEWMQMQATTDGDFEGVGAILTKEGPDIKIVEAIETGPAERAGVKAEDVVTRVDGVSVLGKDLNDVVKRIKGKPHTRVRLTLLRGKTTLDVSILRALVEPPIVKYWMEDGKDKIGHIVLKEFNKKSVTQMNRAFTDLQAQGMRGLVFDLRYNPGGLLDSAIDVASVFIPQDKRPDLHNVVVFTRESSGSERKYLITTVETTYTHRVPTVVLVNDGSASASEIVAGAIKDYGVATLMGERTFGKGRVQTLMPLDEGRAGALRLTTSLYYSPSHYDLNFKRDEDGNRIPGTGGILPEIEVKAAPKWKAEDFGDKVNDAQLHAALNFLRARLHGSNIAQATQQLQDRPLVR